MWNLKTYAYRKTISEMKTELPVFFFLLYKAVENPKNIFPQWQVSHQNKNQGTLYIVNFNWPYYCRFCKKSSRVVDRVADDNTWFLHAYDFIAIDAVITNSRNHRNQFRFFSIITCTLLLISIEKKISGLLKLKWHGFP